MNRAGERTPLTKRWLRRLVLGVLILALGSGGFLVWRVWLFPAVPSPPEVPAGSVPPEVAAAISHAREMVLKTPRSAEAWGLLGKVLFAHEFAEQADLCFQEAEKLDGKSPRWPHFRGLANAPTNTEAAIAGFRRAVERSDPAGPEIAASSLQLAFLLVQDGRDEEAEEA